MLPKILENVKMFKYASTQQIESERVYHLTRFNPSWTNATIYWPKVNIQKTEQVTQKWEQQNSKKTAKQSKVTKPENKKFEMQSDQALKNGKYKNINCRDYKKL